MNTPATPFLITLIGMAAIFIAIALLWGLIMALVQLTQRREQRSKDDNSTLMDRKRKAAIAAVMVALAREEETSLHEFPLPPTAFVSAWQAVMRANIIKRRGQVR
jgi:hypothetical protein